MDRVAVLTSGGLDSAVLVSHLAKTTRVTPLYIQFGLAWEAEEKRALVAFLDAAANPNVDPAVFLELPIGAVYGKHWSTTGENVPGYTAPDEAVYLPGRNVLLIGLAAVWCAVNGVHQIAIGSLDENPFADATPEFFADYSRLLSGALTHQIEVIAPFRGRHKHEIIREYAHLPLDLTITCNAPNDGRHCGNCNKCRERHEAFLTANVEDRTPYAHPLT